ncbi:MAG: DUF547 domain-containing protein [Cyanobacteria bacterium J06641_5]
MKPLKFPNAAALLALATKGGCAPLSLLPAKNITPAVDDLPATFTHQSLAAVLETYVERGRVDYAALQDNCQQLYRFNASLAQVKPEAYAQWSEAKRVAFWIDAYNALTLQVILAHYPTRSILVVPGAWTRFNFDIAGQELTLNAIEHEILRQQFNEPRIHMALVCASHGCPPLRSEPYSGDRLNAQLDDNTQMFLRDPANFAIDREKNTVTLSAIFKWFGQDFVATYGDEVAYAGYSPAQGATLNFISRFLNPADREFLASGSYRVTYARYDWSLNSQS